MQLNGKRKFTVTGTAIVASMIGLFLTPEQAEPFVHALAVAGPLVLGILYDWFQSRQDIKVEETKQVALKNGTSITVSDKGVLAFTPPAAPNPQPAPETLIDFDALFRARDKKAANWDKAKETPTEHAKFYAFRDVGKTPLAATTSLEDVMKYTGHYLEGAEQAFKETTGFYFTFIGDHLAGGKDAETSGCVPTTQEALLTQLGAEDEWRELVRARGYYNYVMELYGLNPQGWTALLGAPNCKAFEIMNRAEHLLPSYRPAR